MTKRLQLADGLTLPLEAVTEKFAWLGRTGSGKTYGAMKCAELMLEAGAQIGVLDPVGVWRALRVPAAPGGQSFEVVVFGGLYGDLPLEGRAAAGELVADLVVDRGVSFVLDVSQFIPSEQQEFARAFAHRFFHRKKSAPSAVHLFLEECQEFIPENPSGKEAMTLGEFQRLWKLGRNFGIGGSLISQRPQEIAKKALNMSGTLFAFQMTGPQERKAIKAWVADQGIATDIEAVLQKLQIGQPHVESPTFLEVSKTIRIARRVTADLSSTPKVGATPAAAKRELTPIDVERLKASMAATIEKAKADDPAELRKRIAELTRQIAAKPAAAVETIPALTEADRQLLASLDGRFSDVMDYLAQKADQLFYATADGIIERTKAELNTTLTRWGQVVEQERAAFLARVSETEIKQLFGKLKEIGGRSSAATLRQASRPAPRVQAAADAAIARNITAPPGDSSLSKGERTVLTILAQRTPATLPRESITTLTGYKKSTRDLYLQRIARSGYTTDERGQIGITTAGLEALGPFEVLPVGDALAKHWLDKLPEGERRVLECVLDGNGKPVDRETISTSTGYKKSTRDLYIQRLARSQIITVDRAGVSAREELFG